MILDNRKCKSCGLVKLLVEFNKGNAKYGKKSECKICQGNRSKEYKKRPEIRDRETKLQNERRAKEPKYLKTIRYLKRKDSINEWIKNNPEKYKRSRKTRNHRRRKGAGKLDLSSVVFLESYNLNKFKNSEFTCEYCSKIIVGPYHLEHILPIYKGGTNLLYNLVIACQKCNNGTGGKRRQTLEEWKPHLVHYINERNISWKMS